VARLRTARAVSAGGVVYRWQGERPEVVLVGREDTGVWGLPKGTPQDAETLEQTAQRETEEETGLEVQVLQPLGQIDYWFVADGRRIHKTVYYYLMAAVGGDTSRHDPEYDFARWFPVDEALAVMTYPNEAEMVRLAREAIARRHN